MIYFIFGGSASGKSEYAEDLAVSCAAARLSGAGEAAVYEEASREIQDRKGSDSVAAGKDERIGGGSEERTPPSGGGPLLYVATMRWDSGEAAARIRKHREQRRGKGFQLYEAESLSALKGAPCAHTILFDCLSDFAANVMFSEENLRRFTESESLSESGRNSLLETYRISLSEEIGTGVRELEEKCENLVIVSDFVFSDGAVYDSLTELYIRLLGDLWKKIAVQADEVTEIVFGLPVKLKQRGRSSMRSAGN